MITNYTYDVFKACVNKHKGYGTAEVRIRHVDMKKGICEVEQLGFGGKKYITKIEQLVKEYITSTTSMPYLTNPSAIKSWSGWADRFHFEEIPSQKLQALANALTERYFEIVNGIGFNNDKFYFELKVVSKGITFSGVLPTGTPFKEKFFSANGKTLETLDQEIRAYLFDTFDAMVNDI
jgi:hypothetical protein